MAKFLNNNIDFNNYRMIKLFKFDFLKLAIF